VDPPFPYKRLIQHPKWEAQEWPLGSTTTTADGTGDHSTKTTSNETGRATGRGRVQGECGDAGLTGSCKRLIGPSGNDCSDNGTETSGEVLSATGRPRGDKKAKTQQRDAKTTAGLQQKAAQNSISVTISMVKRTELMAERNAMIAFAEEECEGEEDKAMRKEFFSMVRRSHFNRMKRRFYEMEGKGMEPEQRDSVRGDV
jgi:hypothetical protein